MGLECGWCHAQKRWSWEFEDFERTVVEIQSLRHAVEFSAIGACGWVCRISTGSDELRSYTSQDAPHVGVGSA